MIYNNFKRWPSLATVAALIFLPINTAQAAVAAADIIAPSLNILGSGMGGVGSSTLFVYSERQGYTGPEHFGCRPGASWPNAHSLHVTFPGSAIVAFPIPVARVSLGLGAVFNIPILVGNRRYSPSLSVGPVPKRVAPLDADSAESFSGDLGGDNFCMAKGKAVAYRNGDRWTVAAFGQTSNADTTGRAAGAAFDPYPVPPGEYPYDHPINLNMEFDRPTDRGDVEYLATDSRFLEPIWSLTIGANGDVQTADQVELSFSIYPGAQGSVLRTSAGAPVDETEVIARVRAALIVTVNNEGLGRVSLPTDFELFAPSTVYVVSALSDFEPPVEYGFGVKAGLDTTGVPPTTKPDVTITDQCSAFPACINGVK